MSTRTEPSKQAGAMEGQPRLKPRSYEIQKTKQLRSLPIGMSEEVIGQSVTLLNQLLADTIMLYDLYKKHHWHIAGQTFYQLHLLLDKHAEEIEGTIDLIAERIQMVGGVAEGTAFDVVDRTKIERPPLGVENVPAMLARTINGHATIIQTVREGIVLTEGTKDYGTNDLLVTNLLRLHETQIWMLSQHLIDTPLVSGGNGA